MIYIYMVSYMIQRFRTSVFLTRTNNCSIRWKKGNKGDSCIWEWFVRRIGTRIELLMIRSRESVQMMLFESFERKYIIETKTNFQMVPVNHKIKRIRKHFENLHSNLIFAISKNRE